MNTKVLLAIFKRDFASYFVNPLGYVFITLFVWSCGVFAFFPPAFWNANLASLDLLSLFFPFVATYLVASIAMNTWAEERRQGTDELLLTIPATDFDVVFGKYLATVAIYTVALAYSLACAYGVLRTLGEPDPGLFLTTCVGYWLVGAMMLAIAMVPSFLAANLTVAFVFGVLLNVPLLAAGWADSFLPIEAGRALRPWSIGEQFRDFRRGILTFSGVTYFLMIVAIMLYLIMVLIARRHWVRNKDSYLQAGHFGVRGLALVVAAVGLNVFFHHHDLRCDLTSEKLSSLSPDTVKLLGTLDPPQPVQIEAFISPSVPEGYVQTRLNIISALREMEARGGGHVQLRINNTDLISDDATRAESFGITPKEVGVQTRGTFSEDKIFLGVSFTCGLQKVVVPFIDRGIPAEYEMIRSLMTVTQQKRKRVGVLRTAAPLLGGPGMEFQPGMPPRPEWPIIRELKKAYEVVGVDPAKLVTKNEDYPKAAFDIDPADREKMIARGMELLNIKTDLKKPLTKEDYPKVAFDIDPKDQEKMIAKGMELLGIKADRRKSLTKEETDQCIAKVYDAAKDRATDVKVAFDIDPTDQDKMIAKGMELSGIKADRRKSLTKEETDKCLAKVYEAAKAQANTVYDKCIAKVYEAAKAQATYDVLLAVQPSSLNREGMDKLIGAIKFGQPVAVFEDPVPRTDRIPGTGGEEGRMGMAMPPQREIRQLWRALGIGFSGMSPEAPEFGLKETLEVVEQEYNPLPRFEDLGPEFVFVDHVVAKAPFNEGHPVSSKLQHLLFIYPGWIGLPYASNLQCDVLVQTGEKPATVKVDEDLFMVVPTERGLAEMPGPARKTTPLEAARVLAAHVHSKDQAAGSASGAGSGKLNVILVADLDVLGPIFFRLREVSGEDDEVHYDFDNVTFVLNVLDYLAGDNRFLEIRKRRPAHRTLTRIGQATQDARNRASENAKKFREEFKAALETVKVDLKKEVAELKKRWDEKKITGEEYKQLLAIKEGDIADMLRDKESQLRQQQQRKEEQNDRQKKREIRDVQDRYKWWVVLLPPIAPLIVGVLVFVKRRVQEREGVSRRRLR
jgi:ABC-type uncharacterized transport system involved in gliding motility auxiliary subunit/ABC-type transport system involved in multi-copper enzyme maturation permease subunit